MPTTWFIFLPSLFAKKKRSRRGSIRSWAHVLLNLYYWMSNCDLASRDLGPKCGWCRPWADFLVWPFHSCHMGIGMHLDVSSGCLRKGFSCLVLSRSAEERLHGVSLESRWGWTCIKKMYEGEHAFKFLHLWLYGMCLHIFEACITLSTFNLEVAVIMSTC